MLRNSLDNQLGICQLVHLRRETDPREDLSLLFLCQLAALDRPRGRVLEVTPASLERPVVDLDADDLETVTREDLDDAGTHGA